MGNPLPSVMQVKADMSTRRTRHVETSGEKRLLGKYIRRAVRKGMASAVLMLAAISKTILPVTSFGYKPIRLPKVINISEEKQKSNVAIRLCCPYIQTSALTPKKRRATSVVEAYQSNVAICSSGAFVLCHTIVASLLPIISSRIKIRPTPTMLSNRCLFPALNGNILRFMLLLLSILGSAHIF